MDVRTELARLEILATSELQERWVRLVGAPAPRVTARMLRLALAWEIQARASGGLPRSVTAKLDQLAKGSSVSRTPMAGMRLVREWGGSVHVVVIGEDKIIRWDEREWNSLSEVARAITGTRWSGPAFFGLKTKKVAA